MTGPRSTSEAASAFFTASTQGWQACSNRQFTLSAKGTWQVNTVGPVSDTDGALSATVAPANSPGVCERVLTAANDVIIDVTACLGPTGAAVNIAHQIVTRVRGH
jgi:serine/threonine kinase PknH